MRNMLFAVVMVVFAMSSAAHAASGFYLGGSAGASKAGSWCEDVIGDCEDVGTGWKVFGGSQFHPNWGLEAAFVDLGEFTVRDTSLGFPVNGKAEVSGISLSGVGTLPVVGPFALLGRIGLVLSSVEISASGGGFSGSISSTSTDFSAGIGAKVDLTDAFFLRAEWERFADVGDDDTGEDDVDLLSVGFAFVF